MKFESAEQAQQMPVQQMHVQESVNLVPEEVFLEKGHQETSTMACDELTLPSALQTDDAQCLSTPRGRLLFATAVLIIVVACAVGAGVGLTRSNQKRLSAEVSGPGQPSPSPFQVKEETATPTVAEGGVTPPVDDTPTSSTDTPTLETTTEPPDSEEPTEQPVSSTETPSTEEPGPTWEPTPTYEPTLEPSEQVTEPPEPEPTTEPPVLITEPPVTEPPLPTIQPTRTVTNPPTATPEDSCSVDVQLSQTPANELDYPPDDCVTDMVFTYTMINNGTVPITITSAERIRGDDVEDLIDQVDPKNLDPGEASVLTETAEVNVCEGYDGTSMSVQIGCV